MLLVITSSQTYVLIFFECIYDNTALVAAAAAIAAVTVATTVAAERANKNGLACLRKGYYQEAVQYFSVAIGLNGKNHKYYSNRSTAYQKTKLWPRAVADAQEVSISLIRRRTSLCISTTRYHSSQCLFF